MDRVRLSLLTARGTVRATTTEDATSATLQVRGPIEGEGWFSDGAFTDRVFAEQLAALPASVKTVVVEINSVGGDMAAGAAMANALIEQAAQGRETVARVVGLAASSASLVAMGAQRIEMFAASLLMIHEPFMITLGNAGEHRKTADVLDKFRDGLALSLYKRHAKNLSEADLVALMAAETWLTADEAVERGFATEVVREKQAEASLDRAVLAAFDVPKRYERAVAALLVPTSKLPTASRVLALCREAKCLDVAEELIESSATLDQVQARITAVTAARGLERQRVDSIVAMCKRNSGLGDDRVRIELADYLIAGGTSAEAAGKIVITVAAMLDRQLNIDSTLTEGLGDNHAADLNPRRIYAARNQPVIEEKSSVQANQHGR